LEDTADVGVVLGADFLGIDEGGGADLLADVVLAADDDDGGQFLKDGIWVGDGGRGDGLLSVEEGEACRENGEASEERPGGARPAERRVEERMHEREVRLIEAPQ
jgi:hypothetical protein